MKSKKQPEHYVNNKEFLEALKTFKNSVNLASENGEPRPQIPYYIGDCLLKIATHLSYRPNFVNYVFREEMISDGVENCLLYIDNFDPERGNPFAYFTQIIYYAFLRRIEKEKKQLKIKNKILEKSGFDEVLYVDSDNPYTMSDLNTIKENLEVRLRK